MPILQSIWTFDEDTDRDPDPDEETAAEDRAIDRLRDIATPSSEVTQEAIRILSTIMPGDRAEPVRGPTSLEARILQATLGNPQLDLTAFDPGYSDSDRLACLPRSVLMAFANNSSWLIMAMANTISVDLWVYAFRRIELMMLVNHDAIDGSDIFKAYFAMMPFDEDDVQNQIEYGPLEASSKFEGFKERFTWENVSAEFYENDTPMRLVMSDLEDISYDVQYGMMIPGGSHVSMDTMIDSLVPVEQQIATLFRLNVLG